jgi:hypothetical protein
MSERCILLNEWCLREEEWKLGDWTIWRFDGWMVGCWWLIND